MSARRFPREVDIAVLGDGPAAAVAVLTLAHAGARVLMVGTPPPRDSPPRIGQCLPPAGWTWMRSLGLEEEFRSSGHRPIVAHRSAWGSDEIASTELIAGAHGNAWRLERSEFDEMLRNAAVGAGASRFVGTVRAAERTRERWFLDVDGEESRSRCRSWLVIDATGRRAAFVRRRGVEIVREDRLVALSCVFESARRTDVDDTTLVEACESGWWYTVRVGAGRRIAVLFSDADLLSSDRVSRTQQYARALAGSGAVGGLLREHGYDLVGAPAVVQANGAYAERPAGDGWLAVGDAACSYDPLCGHGLVAAMDSGRRAAAAAVARANGDGDAFGSYAREIAERYRSYRSDLRHTYSLPQRWSAAPFWARRSESRDAKGPGR